MENDEICYRSKKSTPERITNHLSDFNIPVMLTPTLRLQVVELIFHLIRKSWRCYEEVTKCVCVSKHLFKKHMLVRQHCSQLKSPTFSNKNFHMLKRDWCSNHGDHARSRWITEVKQHRVRSVRRRGSLRTPSTVRKLPKSEMW